MTTKQEITELKTQIDELNKKLDGLINLVNQLKNNNNNNNCGGCHHYHYHPTPYQPNPLPAPWESPFRVTC